MPRRTVQPNKQLALVIQELLDLPTLREATQLLRTVLRVIKDALLLGKPVYVKGFGTFKLVERIHRPTPNNIVTNAPRPIMAVGLKYYKSRRILIFEPSLPLMA